MGGESELFDGEESGAGVRAGDTAERQKKEGMGIQGFKNTTRTL